MNVQARGINYFFAKNLFGDDGPQNIFGYQPTFDTLELKKDKSTDYALSGNQSRYIHLKLSFYMLLSSKT